MPDDSIMDIVNNDEQLYEELQRLYQRWYSRGSQWTKTRLMDQALGKAAFFASTIGQGHGRGHIRDAAKQMVEEFEEYKKYHEEKLRAAAQAEAQEAKLVRFWETSLPPEAAAHAKHYEVVVRNAGIPILRESIPVPPAQVKQALEQGDFNLDSIPMEAWLAAAQQIPYLPSGNLTPEEKVFALKHVAKYHYGI